MGCGSSTSVAAEASKNDGDKPANAPTPAKAYPPAEAFEIPLDNIVGSADTSEGSIIKRHPPKRLLQRLAEPASNQTQTTIEDLEEKLANAEVRRNKFLQQRIDRIKEAGDDTESANNDDAESTNNEDVIFKRNKRNAMEGPILLEAAAVEHQIVDEVEPAVSNVIDAATV